MATAVKKTATKRVAKKPNVVEAATGAIKMPVSFKEFAKKPTAAVAFLAITGIAYVYVDLKKIFENNIASQNVRIEKLEYKDSVKSEVIKQCVGDLATANSKIQTLTDLKIIK